jgi:hypothetical protein
VGIVVFKVITLRIEVLSARRRYNVKDQGGGPVGLRVDCWSTRYTGEDDRLLTLAM